MRYRDHISDSFIFTKWCLLSCWNILFFIVLNEEFGLPSLWQVTDCLCLWGQQCTSADCNNNPNFIFWSRKLVKEMYWQTIRYARFWCSLFCCSTDLMKLKRLPTRMQGSKNKEKKGEAFISRHAGGFCVDFQKRDTNIYLAGTEEGHIHKCSCSYNEQYLESYNGHAVSGYPVGRGWMCVDEEAMCSSILILICYYCSTIY